MDTNEVFFSYLNSLDDDYYFFLANTVLGRIPTPFHKPVLNNKVLSFLLNEENRLSICSALDEEDKRFLSFIIIVGKASAKDIGRFFREDSFILVATRLSNLQDRLVLLRENDLYFINPVLEEAIRNSLDADLVFGKADPETMSGPFVDRNVLFAVANLMISGSLPVREANTHHFLKSGKLESTFPQFTEDRSRIFFCSLKKLLISSKAVTGIGGRFILNRNEMEKLLDLDPLNLMIQSSDSQAGQTIALILGILKTHSMVLPKLRTLFEILSGKNEQQANDILKTIESFGFIIIDSNIVYLNQSVLEPTQKRSDLKVDSDMKVSFFGIPETDDILYLFSDVLVCDKLISYGITKDSFFRALELGLDASEILSYLGPGHESQFRIWQEAFSRLRIYDGVLINCDRDIRTMIENHPDLRDHIIRSFGDDLILMKRSTFGQWQEKLAYAMDLRNLPIPMTDSTEHVEENPDANSFEEIRLPDFRLKKTADNGPWSGRKNELLEYAKKQGCNIAEIEPLIEDRLIVSRSQIDRSFRYAGRINAGGLDYNAKLSAIKSAIPKAKDREAALLRLELPSETLIVQPIEIIKAGPASSVLRARILPEDIEKSIPISSVFQVTVLKWTLR